ncbi:MAG: type I restriction enzyme HsdR N-terminal domain-containing protein [Bacteroidota bacterium]
MKLNLPQAQFKTRTRNNNIELWDEFRSRYVKITPEEWVRQHFLLFLKNQLGYPGSLISVEKEIKINNLSRRYDAVAYNKLGKPAVLMEFKAQNIKITQKVLEQIALYNLPLKVSYLIVSNGLSHYCLQFNQTKNQYEQNEDIPPFGIL